MSDKECCVPGCKESGAMHRVLHVFPNPEKDNERFKSWIFAIGSDILGLENEHIYKYRRVCHSHFEDKHVCRYHRLSQIAVPTLNIPGLRPPARTYSNRKPMQEVAIQPTLTLMPDPPSKQTPMQSNTSLETDQEKCKENIGIVKQGKKNTKVFFTKMELSLRKKIISLRIKLSKMRHKAKQQSAHIKAAKRVASDPAAANDFFENSSKIAKMLIHLQRRENKKKGKGRRFTLEEKIASLTIFKQSPKGYRFLRKVFILPAEQTLIKLIQRSNLKPGLNQNIMAQLSKKAANMKTPEKLCVILFDEVSLKANVSYNERKDKIVGLVDNGEKRNDKFADHAQVFMLRGLIKNYKQPVYYTLAKNATKGPELSKQIKEVVMGVQNAGFIVVATICDQGTNNRQALKLLLNETKGVYLRKNEEPKDNIILINGQKIIPLYDPPHLIKGIRNNLMTKNLEYTIDGVKKTAKWSHLQDLLKENPGYKGIRLIPKLTENHVNPEKMNKMKVKYATQIFSQTVASNMGYLADKGVLSEDCRDTADLILFMDKIFDSVNGSFGKNKYAKPLLGPATPKSAHHKMWEEGRKIFRSMTFVSASGKKETVPSVENWVWALNGIEILLKKLHKEYKISSVWIRHLNQDPLENFFGAVRSHGCRNINPTCDQFESAFATLLINNLNSVHTRGENCEEDSCNALHTLIVGKKKETVTETAFEYDEIEDFHLTFEYDEIEDFHLTPLKIKEKDPRKLAPIQYMSGYFLKKTKSNVFKTCNECISNLSSSDELEYIQYREYAGRRWLCTPSQDLIKLISNLQDIVNEIIKKKLKVRI